MMRLTIDAVPPLFPSAGVKNYLYSRFSGERSGSMSRSRRSLLIFAALQIVGVALDFVGEELNALVQALALLLLLPGSLIASFLPLHALWFPYLWKRYGTDATGLATVLFLPATALINAIVFMVTRYFFRRRRRCAPAGSNGANGSGANGSD